MKRLYAMTTLLLSLGLLLLNSLNLNAQPGAENSHAHQHHTNAALQLNQGAKWQTDAPLRKGMQQILAEAMKAKPGFHDGNLTPAEAETLAHNIHVQVEYIINNCKLEPAADTTLHVLIGDLLQGAESMKKAPLSNEGLPKIIRALNTYPEYFDHPGWQVKH